MGAPMAWSLPSDRRDAAAELVRLTVRNYRLRGSKIVTARYQAAEALGITERQARSLLYREPIAVACDRWERLKRRFLAHLDAEFEELSRRTAEVRAERQQFALLFGEEAECLDCCGGGGCKEGGRARSGDWNAIVEAERACLKARAIR